MVIRTKHLFMAAILLILLISLGIGLRLYLRPTDENQIRKRFSTLSSLAAKTAKEGALPAAGKAKEISELFSEKSTFTVDGLDWMGGPFTRKALSGNIFRARAMFSRLQLSLDDLELDIDPGRGTAKVFFSAVLSGTLKDGRTIREIRELESNLIRTEDGWLFENFMVRRIIKK